MPVTHSVDVHAPAAAQLHCGAQVLASAQTRLPMQANVDVVHVV